MKTLNLRYACLAIAACLSCLGDEVRSQEQIRNDNLFGNEENIFEGTKSITNANGTSPDGPGDLFVRAPRANRFSRGNDVDPFSNAMNKLRDAKSGEAKAEAKAELETLVVNYFDVDMQNRQAEVEKIEQRVQKLRDQINKRKSAKDAIVKLRMQVLESEAEGLGFFRNSAANLQDPNSTYGDLYSRPTISRPSNWLQPPAQPMAQTTYPAPSSSTLAPANPLPEVVPPSGEAYSQPSR